LIERRAVRGDRRVRALYLRRPSGPVLETIWMLRDLAHDEALAGLGPRQQAQLLAAMDRIHRNLGALLPGIADEGGRAPTATRGRASAKIGSARQ
jgi:hypothetical protein